MAHTRYYLWFALACLVAGLAVLLPMLLVPRLRRRLSRTDFELETIGAAALIILVLIIALANRLGAHGGA